MNKPSKNNNHNSINQYKMNSNIKIQIHPKKKKSEFEKIPQIYK